MKKSGDHVKLVYIRKAGRKETTATLGEHPVEPPGHASVIWTEAAPGEAKHETRERLEPRRKTREESRNAPPPPGAPVQVKPPGAKDDAPPK
jgi:hypothetical protein